MTKPYFISTRRDFHIGGPKGDAGLTGRKIIVDTYGGWGAHVGGAFSGKDYIKVDRSAAYAARWVAKSLIKAGLCRRIQAQISYAIGIAEPLSITLDSFGISKKTTHIRIAKNSITYLVIIYMCIVCRLCYPDLMQFCVLWT